MFLGNLPNPSRSMMSLLCYSDCNRRLVPLPVSFEISDAHQAPLRRVCHALTQFVHCVGYVSSVSTEEQASGNVGSADLFLLQWLRIVIRCVVRCWCLRSVLLSETDFFDKHIHISWVMLVYHTSFSPVLLFNALMLSVEPWLIVFVLMGDIPANLFLKSSPCAVPDMLLPM